MGVRGRTDRTLAGSRAGAKALHENATTEQVRLVTLDDMLSAVDVLDQPVGVIAIDVQGAEGHVLRGAMATILRHRPFIMYEDTELAESDNNGKLLVRVLAEMGDGAPAYEPCYCERDCVCSPHAVVGSGASDGRTMHSSNSSTFNARTWGPGSAALSRGVRVDDNGEQNRTA